MILLVALLLAFVVALLRGGKLARLAALPLRWPALPLLALAVQLGVMHFPRARGQSFDLPAIALLLSYLALLLAVWLNRHIPGLALLGLGLLLNLVVMAANGGYMPISPETMERIGHGDAAAIAPGSRVAGTKDLALPQEQTRLWFLSDILILPFPFPFSGAFSPGDVFVAAGAFWTVQWALTGRPGGLLRERRRRQALVALEEVREAAGPPPDPDDVSKEVPS
ncbi:MAG: DUF5317 domain-containing protein [Chloroflexia bacterium]